MQPSELAAQEGRSRWLAGVPQPSDGFHEKAGEEGVVGVLSLSLIAISGLLLACRPQIEVRGLYVSDDQSAVVSCDQPKTLLLVSDSALAASYRLIATQPHQWLFVHLRGVTETHGSIYGGSHHLLVQQILEIRPMRRGECQRVAAGVPL